VYPIDFFFRAAEQYPDRVALDAPEGQVTYARLAADVRALAAALQDLAPAPQTRVALCAGNSSRHILALLAVLASGKIWVPLNYRSTAREIGRILDATEPSIVIVDAAGDALVPAGVGSASAWGPTRPAWPWTPCWRAPPAASRCAMPCRARPPRPSSSPAAPPACPRA